MFYWHVIHIFLLPLSEVIFYMLSKINVCVMSIHNIILCSIISKSHMQFDVKCNFIRICRKFHQNCPNWWIILKLYTSQDLKTKESTTICLLLERASHLKFSKIQKRPRISFVTIRGRFQGFIPVLPDKIRPTLNH